ncbi:hypothetical protein PPSIR1_21344 [Plesiocystis pacifica SIR-1]|uniref:OmpA-like domain-containing protein n=1 Tax=Plesiocystis pacifica SIR-1 TaxID=391625 RepID=A6G3K8_9BACT|nr:hypothetical protein PPSIR1_21344 [Plesiocystis pacifica SIR-1]
MISAIESGDIGVYNNDNYRMDALIVRVGADPRSSDPDGVYRLYLRSKDEPPDSLAKPCGKLYEVYEDDGKGGVELQLGIDLSIASYVGGKKAARFASVAQARFVRTQGVPTVLEHRLRSGWIPNEVRTREWFPITPKQVAAMSKTIKDARIDLDPNEVMFDAEPGSPKVSFGYGDLLLCYFAAQALDPLFILSGDSPESKMQHAASALNKLVAKAWDAARALPETSGGINQHHIEDWRVATLRTLASETLTVPKGVPRSWLTHTQAMLDGKPEYADVGHFRKLLLLYDLHPHETYEAEITLTDYTLDGDGKGKGKKKPRKRNPFKKIFGKPWKRVRKKLGKKIPFGGLVGTLSVEKKGVGAFKATYYVTVWGVKVSKSVGEGQMVVSGKGTAKGVVGQMWKPEDLVGNVDLFDASGGAAKGKGKAVGVTTLRVWGGPDSAPEAPITFVFPGFSEAFSGRAVAGVGGFRGAGVMRAINLQNGDVLLDIPDVKDPFDFMVHASSAPIHFPINGARLRANARHALRVFAACELPQLLTPGAMIEVHGFADRPDTETRNLILSRNRAVSLYVYLKNILGPDFPGPELEALPPEDQELEDQRNAQEPDDFMIRDPSEGVEGVDVYWYGETKAEDEYEGYDHELRRAELYVDAKLRLRLHRPYETVVKGAKK